jgi:hypothetical protein
MEKLKKEIELLEKANQALENILNEEISEEFLHINNPFSELEIMKMQSVFLQTINSLKKEL